MEAILFLVQLSALICVFAFRVTFKLTYRELSTLNSWIWPQANFLLATVSLPDGLYETDKKGNRVWSKEKWEEYPATAGSEGGGTERESQPVFQACCRADTSLPGTVTFGVVPLWLKILCPKQSLYYECIWVRNKYRDICVGIFGCIYLYACTVSFVFNEYCKFLKFNAQKLAFRVKSCWLS